MSSITRRTTEFFNYPVPIETSVPWEEPPVQRNPPMSGSLLYYGAVLCETFNFVPRFLYDNAGFGGFGKVPDLQRYEARYDPTVIPVAFNTKEQGSFNATDVEHLQRPIDAARGDKFRYLSVADFYDGYANRHFTPTDVVNALLPLIRRDVGRPTSHSVAFISSRVDLVTEAAAKSTKRWQEGKQLGVLDGVPFAVKDEVDVQGYLTTHGSKRDYTARGNGTSWNVQQWLNAGAILMGKTNMHEMGLDTCGNNPVHGTPRNPYNSSYYCGGSSGGSAYAVAAGLVPFALGVDGGGSIRLPSSYCGIFGLKTTTGRISKIPTVDATLSNSVNGPMCADMATLEVAYRVQATPDPNHIHSSRFPIPRPLSAQALSSRPKVLGIHQEWWNRCNPEARLICDQAMKCLEHNLGYKVIDISIPHVSIAQKAHAVTILAEAAAAVPDTTDLTPESKCLLSIGRVANGVDLLLAQRMRGLQMSHLAHLFQKHPGLIIMTPTTPEIGWAIKNDPADVNGCGISDGDMSVRSMEYVWLANFSGCPCLQMPVGYAKPQVGKGDPDEERIPIGMMGMGEWASEEELILLGYDVERYLRERYEGGRRKPKAWVDLLGLVESERASR